MDKRKNNFFYILIFINVLMLSLVLCTSSVKAAGEHIHCVCGSSHSDVADHNIASNVEWIETATLPTTSGYYCLTESITISESWHPVDGTFLCLNNHNISGNDLSISVITIDPGVTFTLTDCGEEGSITGGGGTLNDSIYCGGGIYNKGTFYFYGGSICENSGLTGNSYGQGIYNEGTVYMYGGSISNNSTSGEGTGSAIYNTSSGNLFLYGGEIVFNETNNSSCSIDNYGNITLGANIIMNNMETGESDICLEGETLITLSDDYPMQNGSEIGISIGDENRLSSIAASGKILISNPSIYNKASNFYYFNGDGMGVYYEKDNNDKYSLCLVFLEHDFSFEISEDGKTITAICRGESGNCNHVNCDYTSDHSPLSLTLYTRNLTEDELLDGSTLGYTVDAIPWEEEFGTPVIEYSTDEENWTTTSPTTVGTYFVRLKSIAGDDNYNLYGSATIKCNEHVLNHIDGVEPTCDEDGFYDYYQCSECGLCFSDINQENEINDIMAWKKTTGKREKLPHDLTITVNGNSMTVECINSGCSLNDEPLTVTLLTENIYYRKNFEPVILLENGDLFEEKTGLSLTQELIYDGNIIDRAVEVGVYTVKYKFSYNGSDYEIVNTFEVMKVEISLSYHASDKVYDGTNEATIVIDSIDGIIEEDIDKVNIEIYAEFSDSNVGSNLIVTVTSVSLTGESAKYYSLDLSSFEQMRASITKADYDMSGVTFNDGVFYVDDGLTHEIYVSGLPTGLDGIPLTVSYEGNGKYEVGIYTVVAKFDTTSNNYNVPSDMEALLQIFAAALEAFTTPTGEDPNGLKVKLSTEDSLAENASLSVETLAHGGSEYYDNMISSNSDLGSDLITYSAYRINLKEGSDIVRDGIYFVEFDIPSELKNKEDCMISILYYYDNTVSYIYEFSSEDGVLYFRLEGLDVIIFAFNLDQGINETVSRAHDFDSITESEQSLFEDYLDRLNSDYYNLASINYADRKSVIEGYDDYKSLLSDCLCKCVFERRKLEAQSEIENSAHKHTGDNARSVIISKAQDFGNDLVYTRKYQSSGSITIEELIEVQTVTIEKKLNDTKDDISLAQYIDIKGKDLSGEEMDQLLGVIDEKDLNLSEKMDKVDSIVNGTYLGEPVKMSLACKIAFITLFVLFGISLPIGIVYTNRKLRKEEKHE